jgi:hypothetical protein
MADGASGFICFLVPLCYKFAGDDVRDALDLEYMYPASQILKQ